MAVDRVLEQLEENDVHSFYCGIIDPVRGYTRKRLEYRYYNRKSGMILLTRTDVTSIYLEQKSYHKELNTSLQRAQTDSMTGLLNHYGTVNNITDILTLHKDGAAFFFIDLDNFKTVNDSLGHAAGDELLRRVAAMLQQETRPEDVVGRVGGDEFVILLPGLTSVEAVKERAQHFCDAVILLINSDFADLPISCSIGIALAPDDGNDYESLAHKADMKAYESKKNGKNQFTL